MKRSVQLIFALALLSVSWTVRAQSSDPNLETLLTFEGVQDGETLSGWDGSAGEIVFNSGSLPTENVDSRISSWLRRTFGTAVLDTDREFDEGSSITTAALSDVQIENLVVLGKVWGFLKYHHPRVAAGALHWDYELFRVLPDVLEADGPDARNRVLSHWLDRLGVPKCDPCATPPENVHLSPRLKWLENARQLGPVSRQLQDVYRNRFVGDEQFYVSLVPNVSNPVFGRELAYAGQQPPDVGFRLLSLLRYWNIIEYWFPYRNQIKGDWNAVLREFLPRFVAADSWDAYRLELFALIARVQDTHANLWSELEVRPPRGACR